jgi:hypothetical protein
MLYLFRLVCFCCFDMFRATSHHHRPILAPPVDGELHEPNIPQGAHVSPPPWAAMMIISLIWTKHLWYPMVILLIMSYRYILFLWSWSYIVSLSNDDCSLWNDRSWPSWPWGEKKRDRILNNQWFQAIFILFFRYHRIINGSVTTRLPLRKLTRVSQEKQSTNGGCQYCFDALGCTNLPMIVPVPISLSLVKLYPISPETPTHQVAFPRE